MSVLLSIIEHFIERFGDLLQFLFIDSNVFIATLLEGDLFRNDALALLEKMETLPKKHHHIFASVVSLMEIAYVLKKYGKKPSEISNVFHILNEMEFIHFLPLTPEIMLEAGHHIETYNLSLSDAIIVTTATKVGSTQIVSEDKDFDSVPFLNRISIKEALKS